MTWHPHGLLKNWRFLYFAGGTVVHMSAAFAALVEAIYLAKRKMAEDAHASNPHVISGIGLLWFGWFGFNAGSALRTNGDAIFTFGRSYLLILL